MAYNYPPVPPAPARPVPGNIFWLTYSDGSVRPMLYNNQYIAAPPSPPAAIERFTKAVFEAAKAKIIAENARKEANMAADRWADAVVREAEREAEKKKENQRANASAVNARAAAASKAFNDAIAAETRAANARAFDAANARAFDARAAYTRAADSRAPDGWSHIYRQPNGTYKLARPN